jgi:hypothetical protein
MKKYTIWIVAPATSLEKFTFNIHLTRPFAQPTELVGQTVLTENELRDLLTKNLPEKHNTVTIVDVYIDGARSGSVDLRSLGSISLSDEAARNLGWIW